MLKSRLLAAESAVLRSKLF